MLFILVLLVNMLLIPNISKRINNSHLSKIVTLMLVITSILLQTQLYFNIIPTNFYQTYSISRDHTKQQLKAAYKQILLNYHPDKNPDVSSEQFQYLANINAVLTSNKLNYDKYGLTKDEKEYVVNFVKNEQQIHFFLFYGIGLMMLLIQTYPEQYREARKYCLIILGIFGSYEFMIMTSEQFADLYLSAILPQITCFEALFIQKIICSTFIGGILFNIKCRRSGLELADYMINQQDVDLKGIKEIMEEVKNKMQFDYYSKNSSLQRFINLIVIVLIMAFFFGQSYLEQIQQYLE